LFYIFSYHTFDFSAKKNFGTLKPPHENFLRTPLGISLKKVENHCTGVRQWLLL